MRYIHCTYGDNTGEFEQLFEIADDLIEEEIEEAVAKDYEDWCERNFNENDDWDYCSYLQDCWYHWEEITEEEFKELREQI